MRHDVIFPRRPSKRDFIVNIINSKQNSLMDHISSNCVILYVRLLSPSVWVRSCRCRSFEVVVVVLLSTRRRDAVSRLLNQDSSPAARTHSRHVYVYAPYYIINVLLRPGLGCVVYLLCFCCTDSSVLLQVMIETCQDKSNRNRDPLPLYLHPSLIPLFPRRCSVSLSSLHCQSLWEALASELVVLL